MKKITAKEADRQEAIITLRGFIKAGDTVYTVLKHVSKSGMSRSIDVVIIRDGSPWGITHFVARACDLRTDENYGGVKVGGAGMDMGFHLVYGLSHQLFRDAFYCVGEKCPANDHNNERWDDEKKAPMVSDRSATRKHSDAGYALRHSWL